jgi:hypothetical protein
MAFPQWVTSDAAADLFLGIVNSTEYQLDELRI